MSSTSGDVGGVLQVGGQRVPLSKAGAWVSAYFDRNHTSGWFAYPYYRSEEHTSELQSQSNLVCRLLLEKKKMVRRIARLVGGLQKGRRGLGSRQKRRDPHASSQCHAISLVHRRVVIDRAANASIHWGCV